MDMFIYNFPISFVSYVSDERDVAKNGFKNNSEMVALASESCRVETV